MHSLEDTCQTKNQLVIPNSQPHVEVVEPKERMSTLWRLLLAFLVQAFPDKKQKTTFALPFKIVDYNSIDIAKHERKCEKESRWCIYLEGGANP